MSYDIVVIGGGPGGYVAALRAIQHGMKTALVEGHKIGGTCLNYGCIPTKAFYKSGTLFSEMKHAEDFGILTESLSLDVEKLQAQKNKTVTDLTSGVEQLLVAGGVDIYKGMASFKNEQVIRVDVSDGDSLELEGKSFIIATGSSVFTPDMKGIDHPKVVTSKELLDVKVLPENLVILGGGVVAMEFASIFADFGSKVEVIVRSRILKGFDSDMVKRASAYLKKKGVSIRTKTNVLEIREGASSAEVIIDGKKGEEALCADLVLNAMGRRPEFTGLNLAAAGIEPQKGAIQVDDHFRTGKKHIYAIGDVNGRYMLAHAASHQGIQVVDAIAGVGKSHDIKMGDKTLSKMDIIPSCVFISPELAGVGLTEDEAKEEGIPVKVSKFPFTANGKAMTMQKTEGLVKLIALESGQIAGAQILGAHASDLIHEIALAITGEMNVDDILTTVHAHPTLSESILEAGLGLEMGALHLASPKGKKR